MVDKDKEKLVFYKVMKKTLKAALYTLLVILSAMFVIGFLFGLLFDGGDASIIMILCIGIIFAIFYCTITIIEEIKNIK